jgi:chromosome partitioning protein
MITLTICNHKGGTGKTTTTLHLAAVLGLSGKRTLVIDLDPQGFLSNALGAPDPAEVASSLALFDPDARIAAVPFHRTRHFDLLPASPGLSRQMRALNKPTDVFWVKEALEKGVEGYDVVLIDTAAAVTVYSLNALVATQHLLIPVMPEYQPVLGAEQTFHTARMVQQRLNPTLEAPMFLFTLVDARKADHKAYRQYLRDKYGERVLRTIIRTSASLSTLHQDGTTVFDHDPSARGARDYANAADELLRRVAGVEDLAVSEDLEDRWKPVVHLAP